jgi:hypothetical protein
MPDTQKPWMLPLETPLDILEMARNILFQYGGAMVRAAESAEKPGEPAPEPEREKTAV